ncbi:MAG: class II aldolase/adducin family protein [Proteobacteria bacterium]|nr:class II aldolase/adducin family protein [Pseudomonadota bacterium]
MTALRREIVETARRMNALGINQGRSGNVSARDGAGFLITPSGLAYEAMNPGDIVAMALDGAVVGQGKPSNEWPIHQAIYADRPEAGAVVHAHAPHATSLACLGREIPAFHYMVAVAGGDSIPCAGYATPGSQALSDAVVVALEGRRACLMANHGLVAYGSDLAAAIDLAMEVETLAGQYWRALQIGKPKLLSKARMAEVHKLFETYGKPG